MCYGTVRLESSFSWRFPLALQAGVALTLTLASTFYLPESPRWLAYKGRPQEASLVWDKLGVSAAEREKDLVQVPVPGTGMSEEEVGLKARWRGTFKGLLRIFKPDARKQMFLGVFVMAMQQLSGIDGVLYVSHTREFISWGVH